jgi:mannitol/fructose-specific phosphotransferase system IIA component (Ntr-type)
MESKATLKHLIKFINSCFSNTNIVWREINSYLELERANELSHFFDFVIVYGEIIPGKIKPDVLIAGYITPVEKKLIVESILRKSKEIWAQKFENIIMKYFDKELVFHLHTLTPQESIFFLADKAVELGIAEKGFYDAIMRREEFMPTSQPSGVALPHALEFKTNKSVFLIGILDEPIKWGNGKVKLVFLLSSALKDEHTLPSITSFFSSVFSNKDNRSSILKINSYDEIRKVLQSLFYARYDL